MTLQSTMAPARHRHHPAPTAVRINGPVWITRGTTAWRRTGIALFLAGFASFSLIYCVQPLLPAFATSFGLGAASASLALSVTTSLLALSILLAGAFSQALGRRGLMFGSMAA
ncbi:MAG TPA: MFS transporter, partial [Tistrella mobilis]|nr:MFS transporter [Tistrella mobilis]